MNTPNNNQRPRVRDEIVKREDDTPVCYCDEDMVKVHPDEDSSPFYGCNDKRRRWCGARVNVREFELTKHLYKTVPRKPRKASTQRSITGFLFATPSTSGRSASRGRNSNQGHPTTTPTTPTRASLPTPVSNTRLSTQKRSNPPNGEENSSSKKQRTGEEPAEDTVARKLNFSDAPKMAHGGENARPLLQGAKDIVKPEKKEVNDTDETPSSSISSGRRSANRAPLTDAELNRL